MTIHAFSSNGGLVTACGLAFPSHQRMSDSAHDVPAGDKVSTFDGNVDCAACRKKLGMALKDGTREIAMKYEDLEQRTLDAIEVRTVATNQQIQLALRADSADLDKALQRLRKRGEIRYTGKGWMLTGTKTCPTCGAAMPRES